MPGINFQLPTEADKQLLLGIIFSESSTKHYGGENADEKICIGLCVVNMAYYAKQSTMSGKRCYNSSYGNGTILSSIQKGFLAYNSPRWNKIMTGNTLKTKAILETSLNPDEIEHLRLSVVALASVSTSTASTQTYSGLSNRIPLQFNQAANSPPSDRLEKLGKLGTKHTFYGFKIGRECQ